jgi:hypothetical protein
MEYLNVLIGNKEMYIPVNDKLGKTMLLAHKRLNYEKYIARMRHFGNSKMEAERVEISSDFFYALEDILNEQGYPEVIHHLFGNFSIDEQKVLLAFFREDKTIRFLIQVQGYDERKIQTLIRKFFEEIKKKIF